MEEYFKALVAEDTVEAWATLKKSMPWGQTPTEEQKKLVKKLGLKIVEIDTDNTKEVRSLLETSQDGTIFGDFWWEPFLEIGDGFYPYILNCQKLIPLSKDSTPGLDLTNLYKSKNAIEKDVYLPISLLVIVCPRCHLSATEGDPDHDILPEECALDNCIACGGNGEWEFELEV